MRTKFFSRSDLPARLLLNAAAASDHLMKGNDSICQNILSLMNCRRANNTMFSVLTFNVFTMIVIRRIKQCFPLADYNALAESVDLVTYVTSVVRDTFTSSMEVRALNAVIAASFSIDNSRVIRHLSHRAALIINSSSSPFIVTDDNKIMLERFTASVFLFWYALRVFLESNVTNSADITMLVGVMERLRVDDPLTCKWFELMMKYKLREEVFLKLDAGQLFESDEDSILYGEPVSNVYDGNGALVEMPELVDDSPPGYYDDEYTADGVDQ